MKIGNVIIELFKRKKKKLKDNEKQCFKCGSKEKLQETVAGYFEGRANLVCYKCRRIEPYHVNVGFFTKMKLIDELMYVWEHPEDINFIKNRDSLIKELERWGDSVNKKSKGKFELKRKKIKRKLELLGKEKGK